MDVRVKIGQRIRELRTEKGLTQEGVAFKAELDRTYMNHVENGKRNISVINLEKVIVALDSSFGAFFCAPVFEIKTDRSA